MPRDRSTYAGVDAFLLRSRCIGLSAGGGASPSASPSPSPSPSLSPSPSSSHPHLVPPRLAVTLSRPNRARPSDADGHISLPRPSSLLPGHERASSLLSVSLSISRPRSSRVLIERTSEQASTRDFEIFERTRKGKNRY